MSFTLRKHFVGRKYILHVFDGVCKTNRKWVSSFEYTLPSWTDNSVVLKQKYSRYIKKLFKKIAKDNCVAILPMSQWAYRSQIEFMKEFQIENADVIERKMKVLYPPQKLIVDKIDKNKFLNIETLKFIFVGNEFFRKGGYEVYTAIKKIYKQHSVKLILIGDLYKDFSDAFIPQDVNIEKILLELQSSDYIEYYEKLPNNEVLNLMKECHVGLLPTFGDTFGFSVLEMQAAGVPVITTNMQALAEINNDAVGWIIDTATYSGRVGKIYGEYTVGEVEILRNAIVSELQKIIEEICQHSECIYDKAVAAYKWVKENNSPQEYQKKLTDIYLQ